MLPRTNVDAHDDVYGNDQLAERPDGYPCRTPITLVVEAADNASMVPLLQPFWLELGARVHAVPCMTADDLAEGMGRL